MKYPESPLKSLSLAVLTLAMSTGVRADPGVMLGVSHNFGGVTGITLKLLSTDRKDRMAAAPVAKAPTPDPAPEVPSTPDPEPPSDPCAKSAVLGKAAVVCEQ